MNLKVHNLIGDYGITLEDGQKVYDLIYPELMSNHNVELDFCGVAIIAAPFFNAAIGHLFKDINSNDLNQLLKVTNLVQAGEMVLRRVIANSKQYYSSQATRKAIDEALNKQVEAR